MSTAHPNTQYSAWPDQTPVNTYRSEGALLPPTHPARLHLGISQQPPRGPALQRKAPWEELQGKAGKKAKDETGEASKAGKGQARAPQSPMQEDGVGQAGVSENWGRHTLPLGWTQ